MSEKEEQSDERREVHPRQVVHEVVLVLLQQSLYPKQSQQLQYPDQLDELEYLERSVALLGAPSFVERAPECVVLKPLHRIQRHTRGDVDPEPALRVLRADRRELKDLLAPVLVVVGREEVEHDVDPEVEVDEQVHHEPDEHGGFVQADPKRDDEADVEQDEGLHEVPPLAIVVVHGDDHEVALVRVRDARGLRRLDSLGLGANPVEPPSHGQVALHLAGALHPAPEFRDGVEASGCRGRGIRGDIRRRHRDDNPAPRALWQ